MDDLNNKLNTLKQKENQPDAGQPPVSGQLENAPQQEGMTEDWKRFYAEVKKAVERMRE